MNLFIDLEATQFGFYPISIGCINDKGDTYYSVINPGKKGLKKITPFITRLTGLTKDECREARSFDEVFNELFHWCNDNNKSKLKCYCYGNCDKLFLEKALKYTTDPCAQQMLRSMINNLHDYSINAKQHFGKKDDIGLIKLENFYTGGCAIQTHNALDDAIMLRHIYRRIEDGSEIVDKIRFAHYLEELNKPVEETNLQQNEIMI